MQRASGRWSMGAALTDRLSTDSLDSTDSIRQSIEFKAQIIKAIESRGRSTNKLLATCITLLRGKNSISFKIQSYTCI